jgi:hypothetical protein
MLWKKYVTELFERVRVESDYVFQRFLFTIYRVVYVAYIAQVPFRNIAYYRHEQRDTLKDLGFDLIPELGEDNKWLSELVFISLHALGTFVVVTPLLSPVPHRNNVFGVVMAEKWLNCLCLGHTLRFLTYVSTSLPGPASHCLIGSTVYSRPTDLTTILTRKSSGDDPNCGDLIFSGHVFQNIILCIIATVYVKKVYEQKWLHYLIPCVMWALEIAQLPLIVAARNHYTVDLTVSSYLAPLVWCFLENWNRPQISNNEQEDIIVDAAI